MDVSQYYYGYIVTCACYGAMHINFAIYISESQCVAMLLILQCVSIIFLCVFMLYCLLDMFVEMAVSQYYYGYIVTCVCYGAMHIHYAYIYLNRNAGLCC